MNNYLKTSRKDIGKCLLSLSLIASPLECLAQEPSQSLEKIASSADSTQQHTQDERVSKKSNPIISGLKKIGQGMNIALSAPLFLLQAPETALHEGSHAIAFKLTGGKVHDMRLVNPGWILDYSKWTIPNEGSEPMGYVYGGWSIGNETATKSAIVDIAPYAFDILFQHRLYELLYRKNAINEGGLFDSYVKTNIAIGTDIADVIGAGFKGGDLARFSKNTGIPRYVLVPFLTGIYAYSTKRIIDNMKSEKGLYFVGSKFKF